LAYTFALLVKEVSASTEKVDPGWVFG